MEQYLFSIPDVLTIAEQTLWVSLVSQELILQTELESIIQFQRQLADKITDVSQYLVVQECLLKLKIEQIQKQQNKILEHAKLS